MKNIHISPTENSSRLSHNKDGVLELHRLQWRKGTHNIYITSDEEIKEGDWCLKVSSIYKGGGIIQKYSFIDAQFEDIIFKKIILTTDQDLIKDGVQAIDDEFLEWFVNNPDCESVGVVKTIPYNFDCLSDISQDKFIELFYNSKLYDEKKYNDVFYWSENEGKDFLVLFPNYKIIIPRATQQIINEDYAGGLDMGQIPTNKETIEEVAEKRFPSKMEMYEVFIEGAKWQQEQDKKMYSEGEVELIANEMVNWAIDNIGNPNPQSGKKFDEVISKFKNKNKEQTCNHNYILTPEQGHRVIKCSKCKDTQPI
jgi:hypothetical protein